MQKFSRKERVLEFKQFSRKGWSLFACLHREVRIAVLSVATLTSATPRLMAATPEKMAGNEIFEEYSEEPADTLQLGEALVQSGAATRAPLAADVAARQVTAFSQADLQAAGVTTVNDVLKLSAGVDVRQRGGFGIQTDVSIDGGTHDQITILLNGVSIVNPQTGHNAADFPLNLSDIERIEILEGAASRVMGSQAFSGAINIVTKTPSPSNSRSEEEGFAGSRLIANPWLEAGVEAGSYGTLRADARLSDAFGKGWAVSASGSFQRSDGAVDNGKFKGGKGYGQMAYSSEDLDFRFQVGATANDFGANTFYSAAYPDQWESTRRYLVSAQAETKGRLHVSPMVAWTRNVDHYQLIHNSSTGENFHRGDVFTASLNAWMQWALGRTAFGAELRQETIYSSNLGHELDEDQYVKVRGEDETFYTCRDERTNVAYFLEHNLVLRKFTFSVGVMANRNTAVDDKFHFYPGVDVSFRPSSRWRIYASWNRSLRLPSFTDLWYKSPTQEGNVGLKPEECDAFRIGADFKSSCFDLRLKAHYQHGNNMIDWVMYSADDIYHATSFKLNNFGAGCDATIRLSGFLGRRQPFEELYVSYAWLYQHRLEGEDYYKSNYALEYLRHKFVARLSHRIVSSFAATWTLRVQQREGAYLVYKNHQATSELRPYGAHALLDCKVVWTKQKYSLYVDMTNLTSHRYYDIANVLQPGFLVMAGARLRL